MSFHIYKLLQSLDLPNITNSISYKLAYKSSVISSSAHYNFILYKLVYQLSAIFFLAKRVNTSFMLYTYYKAAYEEKKK